MVFVVGSQRGGEWLVALSGSMPVETNSAYIRVLHSTRRESSSRPLRRHKLGINGRPRNHFTSILFRSSKLCEKRRKKRWACITGHAWSPLPDLNHYCYP